MMFTSDPEHDFFRHEEEQEEAYEKMAANQPVCEICGNPILPDDMFFEDNGAFYHTDCLIGASKIMGETA